MSPAAAAAASRKGASNLAVGVTLLGFVGATYTYVIRAVGKSELDDAIETFEQKQKALDTIAKNAK